MMLHRHFEGEKASENVTKLADLNRVKDEKKVMSEKPEEEKPKRGRPKKTTET